MEVRAEVLVASAAAGADLIAHEVAESLGLSREVILPFRADQFERSSVRDRGEDWVRRFRALVSDPATGAHVHVIQGLEGHAAYDAATRSIVRHANALAAPAKRRRVGILIWEGAPHRRGDEVELFRILAEGDGFEIREVRILSA
jgi:hypothetical protein